VGMLDSLSLKNTKLGLETLELMGYDRELISLVLNRANTSVGLTSNDVEAVLGRAPDVLVPSDRVVPRSINEGAPVVVSKKRSPVAAAYRSLAAIYVADATAAVAAQASTNGEASQHSYAPINGNGNGARGRRRLLARRKD
jgi:Flp pilus assembly CpaE family ATPase